MSRRRRRQRCSGNPAANQPTGVDIVPAVVWDRNVAADMALAFRHTHDIVIELSGETRRSGVRWTTHPGEEGVKLLADLEWDAGGPEHVAAGDQMRAMLRDGPDPVLVVAWVDVVKAVD